MAQVVPAPPKPGGIHRPLSGTPPLHAREDGRKRRARRTVRAGAAGGGDVGKRELGRVLGERVMRKTVWRLPWNFPPRRQPHSGCGRVSMQRRGRSGWWGWGCGGVEPQRPPAKDADEGRGRPGAAPAPARMRRKLPRREERPATGGRGAAWPAPPRPRTARNRGTHRNRKQVSGGPGRGRSHGEPLPKVTLDRGLLQVLWHHWTEGPASPRPPDRPRRTSGARHAQRPPLGPAPITGWPDRPGVKGGDGRSLVPTSKPPHCAF